MAFIGQLLTFSVQFTNTSSLATDPTTIRFFLREGVDGTELQWTYAALAVEGTDYPTGMNPVVKDSTGNYHVAFVARKPERHTGFWLGTGAVNQTSETTYFVRHADLNLAEP
jgi:hypothetical protein